MAAALVTTGEAGIPLRDPDNVTGNRLFIAGWLIMALFVLDVSVAVRGSRGRCRAGRRWSPSAASAGR